MSDVPARSVVSRRAVILGGFTAALAACADGSQRRSDPTAPTTDAPVTSPTSTAPATFATTTTTAAATTTTATTGAPDASQNVPYVPGADWDSTTAAESQWSAQALEELVALIGATNGQSVVVLHDGRIVAEDYWRGADDSTVRDVASVQKSITSMLVGIAEGQGLVDLDATISAIVGPGWSAADEDHESAITVRHLLTMTSGLAPRNLRSAHPPGTVWAYNTEAYQRLHPVLEAAAGADLGDLSRSWLFDPIGLSQDAGWYDRPIADPLGSTYRGLELSARDMARLGLLATRRGVWGTDEIVPSTWFERAWTPIEEKADYGMLWWLLGRGPLRRNGAPADAVAALGKADQKIYVIPSTRLVLVRQGDAARGTTLTASRFDRTLLESVAAVLAG